MELERCARVLEQLRTSLTEESSLQCVTEIERLHQCLRHHLVSVATSKPQAKATTTLSATSTIWDAKTVLREAALAVGSRCVEKYGWVLLQEQAHRPPGTVLLQLLAALEKFRDRDPACQPPRQKSVVFP